MQWDPIFDFLITLKPWVSYVLMGLGTLVLVGTTVDGLVDDKIDGGFSKKILAIPVLGDLLIALKNRFSVFNKKE